MAKTKGNFKPNTKNRKTQNPKITKRNFKRHKGALESDKGKVKKFRKRFYKTNELQNDSKLRKKNENRSSGTSGFKKLRRQFSHLPLRERMMEKLKGAKFRFMNEQLYTSDSKEMMNIFKNDQESYNDYHEGFRQQVAQWPINPVDVIIKILEKKVKSGNLIIADFGCGEAKISESLEGLAEVHSFDLVALNDRVIQCNMANTTLASNSVDIAVFCLSLMGSTLSDYIAEANRVLKDGGFLEIAEVESRFESIDNFIKTIERFGFKLKSKDLNHDYFYFLSFVKISCISKKRKSKLPELNLKPCLYKKR